MLIYMLHNSFLDEIKKRIIIYNISERRKLSKNRDLNRELKCAEQWLGRQAS